MNDTSTRAITYHRRPFLKKDAWMKAVLEKKTVFTQASLFKRGHWWYVTALGLLWCRGKIICYYLGPRYIKQNLGWYLPPFKTPQPPSVLFYYVGTLFQQPAKVINHCHAARRRWRRLPRRQWSTFQFFWWIFLHKTDSLHQIMIICHRTS